jgi:hypothetical protein
MEKTTRSTMAGVAGVAAHNLAISNARINCGSGYRIAQALIMRIT